MAQLDKTFPTNDCSMCVLSPKLVECGRHPNIELLTMKEVSGFLEISRSKSSEHPRYSQKAAAGSAPKAYPIEKLQPVRYGSANPKAAYKFYPQAMASAFAIEKRGRPPSFYLLRPRFVQGFIARSLSPGRPWPFFKKGLFWFRELRAGLPPPLRGDLHPGGCGSGHRHPDPAPLPGR